LGFDKLEFHCTGKSVVRVPYRVPLGVIFLSKQAVYFYSSLHDITCVGVVEVSGEGKG